MSKLRKSVVLAALACGTVGGFEGLVLHTYRDAVGVPTYCYGETRNVRRGATFTKPQCDALLLARLDNDFAAPMERCIPGIVNAPDKRYVAFLSLGYNIGSAALCKSTAARKFNAGDIRGACDALLAWNKAGGVVLKGLATRRQKERAMCLEGLTP
jgi:lysozyme